MVTSDPQQRAARLTELQQVLAAEAPPEDRELLLSFAPLVFAELPDRLALELSPVALAARMRDHFRFFAREIPPATQLYKGLPGVHVNVRNLSETQALALGAGQAFPVDSTVVQTHTPDAPFILESLRNYFRKQ